MVNQSKNFFADPNKLIFAGEMTGSLFVLGQELKQKNYPPTSSLTTTVAGLGVRHSPKNLPESADLPSESSRPISEMDLHSRGAALKAQRTLLAPEYAVPTPGVQSHHCHLGRLYCNRTQSVPLVGACGGGVEAAFILSQGAIKVLRFVEIILTLFKISRLSLIPATWAWLLTAPIPLLICFFLISCELGNSEILLKTSVHRRVSRLSFQHISNPFLPFSAF